MTRSTPRIVLAALALAAGLPLYGQVSPPKAKAPDAREDRQEKSNVEPGGVAKGTLKPAVHPLKTTAGQTYIIKVTTHSFHPITQIKDETLQKSYFLTSTVVTHVKPGQGLEYVQQFSYLASEGGDFRILISPNVNSPMNTPMEYTLQVTIPKTVFTASEQLTPSDPFYPLRGNCYHKVFPVELKAGTFYQIDMITSANGGFGPFLYVEDALGNILKIGQSQYSGTQHFARIYFQPAKTDTYRLIATSLGTNQAGPFHVTVTDTPQQPPPGIGGPMAGPGGGFGGGFVAPAPKPKPKPIKGGPAKKAKGGDGVPPGSVSQSAPAVLPVDTALLTGLAAQEDQVKDEKKDEKKDGPKDNQDKATEAGELNFKGELKPETHPFKLTAGQIYAVKVMAKNFLPKVQIRNAQNGVVYTSTNNATQNATSHEFSLVFAYNPSVSDTFTVQIQYAGDVYGPGPLDYTIDVSPLKLVLAKSDQLTTADPFYVKRPNCYYKVYPVALKAGVTYQMDLIGPFSPFLYLENAGGAVVLTNLNGGGLNHARLVYTPKEDGEYRIVVTSQNNFATGQFTLTVSDAPLPGGLDNPVLPGGPKSGFGGTGLPGGGGFGGPGGIGAPGLPGGAGGIGGPGFPGGGLGGPAMPGGAFPGGAGFPGGGFPGVPGLPGAPGLPGGFKGGAGGPLIPGGGLPGIPSGVSGPAFPGFPGGAPMIPGPANPPGAPMKPLPVIPGGNE